MNAEFNWWLLIVGLVIGASLTWLVMAETTRREVDVAESERRSEALWIATILGRGGRDVPVDRVEDVLRLHREYLAAPPPDEPADPDEPDEPVEPSEPAAPGEPSGPAAPEDRSGRADPARSD
jgi:hypothetical protein